MTNTGTHDYALTLALAHTRISSPIQIPRLFIINRKKKDSVRKISWSMGKGMGLSEKGEHVMIFIWHINHTTALSLIHLVCIKCQQNASSSNFLVCVNFDIDSHISSVFAIQIKFLGPNQKLYSHLDELNCSMNKKNNVIATLLALALLFILCQFLFLLRSTD